MQRIVLHRRDEFDDLGGGTPEARFSTAQLVFNANISLPFQHVSSIPKTLAHFTKLCLAVFCKFLGDFWDVWEEIVFLKRLVKFGQIRNIKDLM